MNKQTKKITLNAHDRKIISKNSGICTESHGNGCGTQNTNEHNRNLN